MLPYAGKTAPDKIVVRRTNDFAGNNRYENGLNVGGGNFVSKPSAFLCKEASTLSHAFLSNLSELQCHFFYHFTRFSYISSNNGPQKSRFLVKTVTRKNKT